MVTHSDRMQNGFKDMGYVSDEVILNLMMDGDTPTLSEP